MELQHPDRRALSAMAPDLRLVHIRLEVWSRWARDPVQGAFPRRTILGRVIDEGPAAGHCTAPTAEIPEAIAETDRAVAHLPHEDSSVIRAYYLTWASRELVARKVNMPVRKFDVVLNRARWRICGYLAALGELSERAA